MTDLDALMRAVLSQPAEDTPRLLYADYLEENAGAVPCGACDDGAVFRDRNEPRVRLAGCTACRGTGRVGDGRAARAEFVRVQVALAGLPEPEQLTVLGFHGLPGTSDQWKRQCVACRERYVSERLCDYHELRRREGELLRDGFVRWGPAPWLTPGGARDPGHWEYRRGFVEGLTCTAADWLAHHGALYWHPGQPGPERCDECRGDGRDPRDPLNDGEPQLGRDCPACDGSGRRPRPFVPTAHPLTDVSFPSVAEVRGTGWVWGFGDISFTGPRTFTCPRWPGITFHLPGDPGA